LHKTAVFGAVERGGLVVAVTVPNVKRATLIPQHGANNVIPRKTVYTDE
jgi:hypothetical protein